MAAKVYENADELRKVVNTYFSMVEAKGEFPDYAGMKIFIGIKSDKEIERLCKDPEFADVFDEAELRRESYLVRKMTRDNKAANGCLNALKQKRNGGYSDRPAENKERKLIIDLKGIGENAYK